MFLDFFEIIAGDEDVDVFGEAADAVVEEGHAADDGVGDVEGVEAVGDAAEGDLDVAFAFEEDAAFGQSPPRVAGATLLVGDWESWGGWSDGLGHAISITCLCASRLLNDLASGGLSANVCRLRYARFATTQALGQAHLRWRWIMGGGGG